MAGTTTRGPALTDESTNAESSEPPSTIAEVRWFSLVRLSWITAAIGPASAVLVVLVLGEEVALLMGTAVSAVWLALVVYGLTRFGRRGLWLLLGAPIGLFVPIMFALFAVACSFGPCW